MTRLLKKTAATLIILTFVSLNVMAGDDQCPLTGNTVPTKSTKIEKTQLPDEKQIDPNDFTGFIMKMLRDISFLF